MSASIRTQFILVCFLVGITLGDSTLQQPSPLFYGLVLGGSIICILNKKRSAFFLISLAITTLCLGLLYTWGWRNHFYTSYHFGQSYHFTGSVSQMPDQRQDKTLLTVHPDQPTLGNQILVYVNTYPVWRYGDKLEVTGIITQPEAFNGFDYPLYLERSHIFGIITQAKAHQLPGSSGNPLLQKLYALHEIIEGFINTTIPEPEASFLAGILLGSKRSLAADVVTDLQNTGTTHIIAISGANITITLAILLQILPLHTRKQQFWTVCTVALFLTCISGAPASVVRGTAIAIIGSFLRMLSRRAWPAPLILLSCALLLLDNPLLIRADPGFQLSVGAFTGLLYCGPICTQLVAKIPLLRSAPDAIKSSAAETFAATLGTLPLSFAVFGQLSLLAFIVNPLVLWLLPSITLLGIVLVTVGWILPVSSFIKLPLWLLLHTALAIIHWFSQFTFGIIHYRSSDWSIPIFYLGIALCVYMYTRSSFHHDTS